METVNFEKLQKSISNLDNKSSRIYFFVQDTKGNAKASVSFIYRMAMSLKNSGYNPTILHETKEYIGVSEWLGPEYMDIPHSHIEGQQLEISPEDILVVPEIFGYMMNQVSKLPCSKIVLCQSADWIVETLPPGQNWSEHGFTRCIVTSEWLEQYVSPVMRNVSYSVINPIISDVFKESEYPKKPIISVHSRDQRDGLNLIKTFYLKYPQFRWVTFRDMRGLTELEFSKTLQESCVSVWIDPQSSFGTFPIESMSCGTPVIGVVPNLKPNWMNEDNGIWVNEPSKLVDIIADYFQNWIEDNISDSLYESGKKESNLYQNTEKFNETIISYFDSLMNSKKEYFAKQLNKFNNEEVYGK